MGAVAEQSGDGEGEVAFAGARIQNMQRLRGRRSVRRGERIGDGVLEELGEFLDLAKFIDHALAGLTAVVGDTEVTEPRGIGRDEMVLHMVVGHRWLAEWSCPVRDRKHRMIFDAEASGAVGQGFELGGLGCGEEVGVEERGTEQGRDLDEGLGGREIFGDVAGGVAPHQLQVLGAAQHQGAHQQLLQIGLTAMRAAQHQAHQAAIGQAGLQAVDELVDVGVGCGVGWLGGFAHGPIVPGPAVCRRSVQGVALALRQGRIVGGTIEAAPRGGGEHLPGRGQAGGFHVAQARRGRGRARLVQHQVVRHIGGQQEGVRHGGGHADHAFLA